MLCALVFAAMSSNTSIVATVSTGNASAEGKSINIKMDYHSMQEVVGMLRATYGARICFEELDFDPLVDSITFEERIQSLRRLELEEGSLSPRQRLLLAHAERSVQMGVPLDAQCDLNFFRLSGYVEAATIDEVLGAITEDSPYAWSMQNGTYVVGPRKNSVLGFSIHLNVTEQMMAIDIMKDILDQGPQQHGFSVGVVHFGINTIRNEAIIERLILRDVPATAAMNRVVEAAGGNVCWTLLGVKGNRVLYLSNVPVQTRIGMHDGGEEGNE